MKKFILISILTLFVSSLSAQVGQARTLIVKDGQMAKFSEGIAKKTQMYNRSEDSDQYYTCLLYTSPSPRDSVVSRMPSSA